MEFNKEADFEKAMTLLLPEKGWEAEVIRNPTEEELIQNWADILFHNNREVDRLNDCPLTNGEMGQIMSQIATLRTPLKLNAFINGKTVSIVRDNPNDTLHFGKEISLKIYDRREIAAGQSRYQIVQQPKFKSKSAILNNRRGDLMLLINGMPVIHMELKRSGVSVSQAYNQIEKYAHEGIFTGIFSLVQIFVAMEPAEAVYFANPGADGKFNKDFYFHWADFNNEPINDWREIASKLLSIPMAHQLIGFYTVADGSDGVLKVMRSYQYYAANAISDCVSKNIWEERNRLGGYIWHTTGSGKTMTSFKSAQLIANSKDADKVVFLMDRIELGTQSLKEYRGFADENESVQATEDTATLISKLKSDDPANILIVTSIQKMSNIKDEGGGMSAHDMEVMNAKRSVFIVDEAHRSTFGDMLIDIKNAFPTAIFFGFTGTPIQDENQKKMSTTATVFGNELHRYSIADGIRDKNVLGFDPYKVLTYRDKDMREAVALERAKAATVEDALADPAKKEIFFKYMNHVKMAGYEDENGEYIKGIEDFVPTVQFQTNEHKNMVVSDIADGWLTLSHASKFHAIFATSSIPEAIAYYRLMKSAIPTLKTSCLFDPTIDNNGNVAYKEDGLVEIVDDYNKRYGHEFTLKNFDKLKKDMAARLAHKKPYQLIERTPAMQLDLLIVVDQMLTGFDSKWINTLYMDKMLRYENIIQAFSRTNRLFGPDKPFGTIRYYRKPHTMEQNIKKAVKLYSGDKPIGLFVEKLEYNLAHLNTVFDEIRHLFTTANILNFEKLPVDPAERGKYASLFKKFNDYLEAASIQGFTWEHSKYEFSHGRGKAKTFIKMELDENIYLVLAMRYKELFASNNDGSSASDDVPFEIDSYLTEIDTGKIDSDYMNSRFDKYLKTIHQEGISEAETQQTLNDLHKSFAMLTQEEQKHASIFLNDVNSGSASLEDGKTFRDYITEYQFKAKNEQIHRFVTHLGIDEKKLRAIMTAYVTKKNINEFGRFDELKATVDSEKARLYFEKLEGVKIKPYQIAIKADTLLRKFIFDGGFDIEEPME